MRFRICAQRGILTFLLLLGCVRLPAQELRTPELRALLTGPPASLALRPDVSEVDDPPLSSPSRKAKSPALAVLLSAVLPGIGGQAYTEQYWRIPVYGGLFYWFGRNYVKGNDLYKKYGALYAESVALGVNGGLGDRLYRRLRDFYVNERERFAMYIVLTYVANMVDAYVSASLSSFDVGESLTGEQGIRLQILIPIGGSGRR